MNIVVLVAVKLTCKVVAGSAVVLMTIEESDDVNVTAITDVVDEIQVGSCANL